LAKASAALTAYIIIIISSSSSLKSHQEVKLVLYLKLHIKILWRSGGKSPSIFLDVMNCVGLGLIVCC
jgi:hypothetical protein